MRINRQLNLVIPVQTESSGTIYIHSASISRDVFDQYYAELGKVFTQCFDSSNTAHLMITAPQIAYSALKSVANKAGNWEGVGGVKFGLVNEIIRLSNAVVNGEKGWSVIPFDNLVKLGKLTEDEECEVLSSLIFFTAICKVAPMDLRTTFLEMVGQLRNWEISYLDVMAYQNSLVTLTEGVNSGEKVTASSVIA